MSVTPWIDEPRWKDDGRVLAATVALPPSIRTPADNGDPRLDVEIHGDNAEARVVDAAAALARLVAEIPTLSAIALQLAPPDWRASFPDASLWLAAIEFHADGSVRLDYDFGDLNLLILTIDAQGKQSASIQE